MDVTRNMINKVRTAHNPDFELMQGMPPVTWAEAGIVEALDELLIRIEKIERENENLLKRVGFLEGRLIGFIKYGFRGD